MSCEQGFLHEPNKKMSYEVARDRLQQILNKLQEPSQSLENSLDLWEEGKSLVQYCESILQDAIKRLNIAEEKTDDKSYD